MRVNDSINKMNTAQFNTKKMNLNQFDFNLLKVLYALLLTSSTKEAAAKLHISPSAVSHALSRLRASLGDPLFKRENNKQIPTPFALSLKEKLVPLFISLNDDLFTEAIDGSRTFKVVCPPALIDIITPILSEQSELAGCYIECVTYQRRSWRDEVLDGSIDLVFAVGSEQKPVSSLKYETIGESKLLVIYGKDAKLEFNNSTEISLEELVKYKHVYCLPWLQDENELDRQLNRRGMSRNIGFKCPEYSQVIPALNNSSMLAIVPEPWLRNSGLKNTVNIRNLPDDLALGRLFIMYRKSMQPWKKKIVAILKSKAGQYYE